ncbi:phage antirepressor [Companilactobacillus sp. HBUAS59699]|uniref:phage antirepressor n=1 Tax=Companilactobacillus sp. HBUAS59699 TaxID=3109358 RepID=UPI002FF3D120
MNDLQEFNFKGNRLQTIQIDNEPYFVAKDITKILGLSNTTVSLQRLDSDEVTKFNLGGLSGETNLVNEYGLYSLILSSRKKEAKVFKRWITHEVLPSIRKHGAYLTDSAIEKTLTDPDYLIKLATQLKTEHEGRLIAEQQVNELQPKATYYDQVLTNSSLVSITIIAKDYGMSAQAMNKLLHDLKVQFKQGKNWFLYAKYQKTGWTHSETFMVTSSDGTEHAKVTTKWTQKGRLGLYELLKQKNVLPLIEQDETVLEV